MPENRNANAIAGFLDAQRFTRDQVFGEPCPVPSEPGAFGWWFRTLPAEIDVSGCEQRDGLTLLYVGISPTPPPASGKPPVSEDLRKRIRYHFGGGNASAEGSTLRKSLGVLLAKELGIELRRIGSGERSTFAGGEAVLTQWMAEHTLVSWVVRGEPWHFEGKLIAALDLPLNIQGNKRNAYYAELKRRRREAAVNASKLRVLKEW
ncbi:MAG: hypothetical protein QOJ80_2410 [Mycobacterium sp.]|jgi:hypothetical protein|nr:hypothetical protein [Mycobacterium sp.]